MPNPACNVNGSTPPVAVTASSTVNGGLVSSAGATYWFLGITQCDDSSSLATLQASLSINQTNKTFSFTAPSGRGSCVQLTSTVSVSPNGSLGFGKDINGNVQPSYTTTFKVNVLTTANLAVMFPGELGEQDATSGWTKLMNAAIRAQASSGSPIAFPWYAASSVPLTANTTLSYATTPAPFKVALDPTGGHFQVDLSGLSPSDGDELKFFDSLGNMSITNYVDLLTYNGSVGHNIAAGAGGPKLRMNSSYQSNVLTFNASIVIGGITGAWLVQ